IPPTTTPTATSIPPTATPTASATSTPVPNTSSGPAACVSAGASPTPSPTATPAPVAGSVGPYRAAFYYPWYYEHWYYASGVIGSASRFQPTAGYYSESQASTISTQIDQMQTGKIDVGLASWWGCNTSEDMRIPLLLNVGAQKNFKWALLYE